MARQPTPAYHLNEERFLDLVGKKKKRRLLVRGMCSLYGIQIFVLVNEVLLDHSHAHPR